VSHTSTQYQQGTFNIATVEQGGNNNSNARKNNAAKSNGNNSTASIVQEFSATVNGGHYANQIQNLIITTTIIQSGVKNTANQTQIGNVNIWSQAKL
jgi:hypothetical protein